MVSLEDVVKHMRHSLPLRDWRLLTKGKNSRVFQQSDEAITLKINLLFFIFINCYGSLIFLGTLLGDMTTFKGKPWQCILVIHKKKIKNFASDPESSFIKPFHGTYTLADFLASQKYAECFRQCSKI